MISHVPNENSREVYATFRPITMRLLVSYIALHVKSGNKRTTFLVSYLI